VVAPDDACVRRGQTVGREPATREQKADDEHADRDPALGRDALAPYPAPVTDLPPVLAQLYNPRLPSRNLPSIRNSTLLSHARLGGVKTFVPPADSSCIRWVIVIAAGGAGFLVGGAVPAAAAILLARAALRLRRFARAQY
jgi:hypothetical protein